MKVFFRKYGPSFPYIIASYVSTRISFYVVDVHYKIFVFLLSLVFLLAVFHYFAQYVLQNFKWYRRIFDPIYPFEGYWFELVAETMDHPYSIARIYKSDSGDLCYEGHNYTKNFKFNAFWKSNKVAVYPDGSVGFLFSAKIFREAREIQGAGSLTFSGKKKDGVYLEGVGVFADYDGDCRKYHLKLERITDDNLQKIFGKIPEILDDNNRVEVIKYFISRKLSN